MSKKKFRKSTLFLWIVMSGILIFAVIPYGFNLRRKINIKKDMESVYTDAEFVSVKCETKPTDRSELEQPYLRFYTDFEIPKYDLYAFHISDSEGYKGKGYATKDGKVVFDTYATKYYNDEVVDSLKEVVDFEHNFPELNYYIVELSYAIGHRFVLTHDCTTFEGYKKADAILSVPYGDVYPELLLYIDDKSEEKIETIEGLLANADFDMFVYFKYAVNDISDANNIYDIRVGGNLGYYDPLEKSNEDVISD